MLYLYCEFHAQHLHLKEHSFLFFCFETKPQISIQIYTENWVNSPGQAEDNSWQAFVFAPKGNWYTAKASLVLLLQGNWINNGFVVTQF